MKKQKNQTKTQKRINNSKRFQKFYFLIPILTSLSTIWSTLLIPCLHDVFFKDSKMKPWALAIAVVIILPNAFLLFVRTYYDWALKNDDDVKFYEKLTVIYKELITSFSHIVDNKKKRLVDAILKNSTPFIDSNEQISDIFSGIKKSLSFLLTNNNNRIGEDDIYVNLLYKTKNESNWNLIEQNQEGLSYDGLMDKNSFFTYLLEYKGNYLFFNEKQKLLEDYHYLQDERDEIENGRIKGSILGYKFCPIRTGGEDLQVLLFFSTFNHKFVESQNDDTTERCKAVRENIKNVIINQYVPRLSIELLNTYLKNCK